MQKDRGTYITFTILQIAKCTYNNTLIKLKKMWLNGITIPYLYDTFLQKIRNHIRLNNFHPRDCIVLYCGSCHICVYTPDQTYDCRILKRKIDDIFNVVTLQGLHNVLHKV